MSTEPFEVWEHRIDELLNKKLKPIKDKLRKLDESQRMIAHFELLSIANDCRKSIHNRKSETPRTVLEQLTAKLSIALKEIGKSADPISVVADFHDWCMVEEKKLGITFIEPPD